MKTNFKYIKTVVAIVLALVIYSCNDELIEQQDVSNTNQEFSKKPIKNSIEYWGNFVENTNWKIVGGNDDGKVVDNQLVSNFPGNSSSLNFTIQWLYCIAPDCNIEDKCKPIFNLNVSDNYGEYCPNYRVQISLHKKAGKITGFQMWLHDETYRFSTDKIKLDPFAFPVAKEDVVILIPINKTVELYRNIKGSGSKKREYVDMISIGSLLYCQKETCNGDIWGLLPD